jgi:hypothetical protein
MLDTSQVTVVGYGKINLDTEKLDLALKSSPKKGLGVNGLAKLSLSFGELTKPFKLSGTLANPSMTIDPKGTSPYLDLWALPRPWPVANWAVKTLVLRQLRLSKKLTKAPSPDFSRPRCSTCEMTSDGGI